MTNRKLIVMVAALCAALLTTGCWNRRELNDIAIVAAIGIDKRENGYLVTIQAVDPGEVASRRGASGRPPVTTYYATGTSVIEAVRKMTTLTPRKPYFAHLRILVIGEEMARSGIADILDVFSRDQEARTDFYIVAANGQEAREVLNVLTPLEKIPAGKMYKSLEVSEKSWAPTVAVQLDELLRTLVDKGRDPVLTGIQTWGHQAAKSAGTNSGKMHAPLDLNYRGIGVLKGDKLVGWLNLNESKGFSDITNRLQSTVIETDCPSGGKITLEIIRSKSKIKGTLRDDRPEIDVYTKAEANVAEVSCRMKLMELGSIAELERKAEDVMKSNAEQAVAKAKRLGSDIFGFGEAVHRANPRYWNRVKDDWDKHFKQIPVRLHIHVQIKRVGTVGDSFMLQLKKE